MSIPTSDGPNLWWWLCTITTLVTNLLFSLCYLYCGEYERVEWLILPHVKHTALGVFSRILCIITIRWLLVCSFEQWVMGWGQDAEVIVWNLFSCDKSLGVFQNPFALSLHGAEKRACMTSILWRVSYLTQDPPSSSLCTIFVVS